jgi:hypothetical protein
VILQLEVEAIAEQLPILRNRAPRLGEPAGDDELGDLGRQASREADQPLGVLGEQVPVRARLVVVALEPGPARELDEIAVAGVVGGQEREVAGPLAVVALGRPLAPVAEEEIALHTEDRLDAGGPTRLVEVERAVHDPVVGDGTGGHVVPRRGLEHVGDAAGAVQHRVLGMSVQMDEAQALRHPREGRPRITPLSF